MNTCKRYSLLAFPLAGIRLKIWRIEVLSFSTNLMIRERREEDNYWSASSRIKKSKLDREIEYRVIALIK